MHRSDNTGTEASAHSRSPTVRPDSISATLAAIPDDADHRVAEVVLRHAGWTRIGAGDWAIALASPDDEYVARISPFDPVGPYTAALYRAAASTGQVPQLSEHRRLAGGGDLQVLERLWPVAEADAAAFHARLTTAASDGDALRTTLLSIHAQAAGDLHFCGPLDLHAQNVMRRRDDTLVVIDPYFADGPALYALAASDPDRLVALIPERERRYMTEIPLTTSGPWSETQRRHLRDSLAAADQRAMR